MKFGLLEVLSSTRFLLLEIIQKKGQDSKTYFLLCESSNEE